MNSKTGLALFVGIALISQHSHGLNAANYDTNKDGIISHSENRRFALDIASKPLTSFDVNGNGKLDANELTAVAAELEKASLISEDLIHTFESEYPNGQGLADYAKDRKSSDWVALQNRGPRLRFPIKIREKHEDVSHTKSATIASKVKPALIAFSRDEEANNEVLTFAGTLLWPINLNPKLGLLGVPSVAINKVTNDREPEKEIDSLVLRFGLDLERRGKKDGSFHYLRLNPTWTTDTDIDLDIRGAELQYEPTGIWKSSGSAWFPRDGFIGIRTRTILHAEYGKIEDPAGKENLIEGDSFSRAGLKLETMLVPRFSDRIALDLGWTYLYSLSSKVRDRKLFSGALVFSLDEDQHFSLQAKYTNGDPSAALEDQELWTVGLGIRF